MVVPVGREGKVGDCPQLTRGVTPASIEQPVSSRKAGGRKEDTEPHKVGVNVPHIHEDSIAGINWGRGGGGEKCRGTFPPKLIPKNFNMISKTSPTPLLPP
jgi:hypothetical protein